MFPNCSLLLRWVPMCWQWQVYLQPVAVWWGHWLWRCQWWESGALWWQILWYGETFPVQCHRYSAHLSIGFDSISRIKICCLYFEHWSICQLFQLGRNLNIRKFIWRHLYPCQLGMWWWSWLWRWWPEWWTWRLYWDWVPWHPVHLWQIQMCPS